LVLDSDGEDVITTIRLKLRALSLAFSRIITVVDEFAVNVEGVVVVSYDDVGNLKNRYFSKRSGRKSAVANAGTWVAPRPDPFGLSKIERTDMADE
jgi:hypothetical protein